MKQVVALFLTVVSLLGCQVSKAKKSVRICECLFGESLGSSDNGIACLAVMGEAIEAEFSIEEQKILYDTLSDSTVMLAYQTALSEKTPESVLKLQRLVQDKGVRDIFSRFASDTFQEALSQKCIEYLCLMEDNIDYMESVLDECIVDDSDMDDLK